MSDSPAQRAALLWSAARRALRRLLAGGLDFLRRLYDKAGQDNLFFLAGGIAFNVLIAAVPFLLLLIAILSTVLQRAVEDPEQVVVDYVIGILPSSPEVVTFTRDRVTELIEGRTRFSIVGFLFFVWFSTRLIGSLRTALRDIFDLSEDRGIIKGKIFDAGMVVVAGSLFAANTGITFVIEAVHTFGVRWLGLVESTQLLLLQAFYAQLLAFAFIFLMFVLMYRYLPARRTPWRVSLVAATFSAFTWEMLKSAFAWYLADVANYATTYRTLAALVALVLWIYYSAVVFILGGEVGQVYDLYRIRRRQKELLE